MSVCADMSDSLLRPLRVSRVEGVLVLTVYAMVRGAASGPCAFEAWSARQARLRPMPSDSAPFFTAHQGEAQRRFEPSGNGEAETG